MGRSTDQMLSRYVAEIEDRQQFIDGLVQSAQEKGEDLSAEQLELVTRAKERIEVCNAQMAPLEEAVRISGESTERVAQLAKFMSTKEARPSEVRYRSAGEYMIERWRAGLGNEDAQARLSQYHRAAAHQTTADNPGIIPSPVVEPVLNFIDAVRPLVSALGPRNLSGPGFSRPKVTQHTSIAEQTAEKSELVSQKMVISKLTPDVKTFGGYVNVSRQDVDWTQPEVMDIVIQDLAAQYAVVTENDAADTFLGVAAAGPTLPTGTPTPDDVTAAFWEAAGMVYTATQGAGRVIAAAAPSMLGIIGPLFAPINPSDTQSQGFWASNFGQGAAGAIGGIPVYISAGVDPNNILVLSTAAAEVYEDRVGSLQVVEPSVLGVQVAYAGYFASMPVEATGIVKVVKTP